MIDCKKNNPTNPYLPRDVDLVALSESLCDNYRMREESLRNTNLWQDSSIRGDLYIDDYIDESYQKWREDIGDDLPTGWDEAL